ncbi:MAG TPA: hypothetical protein VFJ96_08960 [Gemmatimonadaceae bacterium]|jgi:hypothetical protein|nr:hypothetical protein [Gemmatimonadaceae bacterium]
MPEHPIEHSSDALRDALERYLHKQLRDTELRRELRSWVDQTKATGLRAEEVIIRFNDVWNSIPELKRVPPTRQRRLRERLVSTCIAEYYGEPT